MFIIPTFNEYCHRQRIFQVFYKSEFTFSLRHKTKWYEKKKVMLADSKIGIWQDSAAIYGKNFLLLPRHVHTPVQHVPNNQMSSRQRSSWQCPHMQESISPCSFSWHVEALRYLPLPAYPKIKDQFPTRN